MIGEQKTPETVPQCQDAVILGGGLAGLTLALQIQQQRPGTRITILEKMNHPVPEAAHKVGESSVEIGAHYFAEVLGLRNHIRDHHYPKLGLRFFFKGREPMRLDHGLEFGSTSYFPTPSYQFDRGRLENHLAELVRERGMTFHDGARVRDLELSSENKKLHRVTYDSEGETHTLDTRWVLDASGRAAILKRKLGLAQDNRHYVNSSWFRINDQLRIDDWLPVEKRLENPDGKTARWLSTNHLMGPGYWVWLIPLSSGSTSIGIVADPRIHPLNTFNQFDRALAWLLEHEPECGKAVAEKRHLLLDFVAIKNFSHGCRQVFSADRWALTGEAGVFLDPFYSPGSDFIAFANTMITELVTKDLNGRPITALSPIMDKMFIAFYENTLPIYKDQYPLFGQMKIMPIKIIWDWAIYWTMTAYFFFRGKITDLSHFVQIRGDLNRMNELNLGMQAFFRAWHEVEKGELEEVFVNQSRIGILRQLNANLLAGSQDGDLNQQFQTNFEIIRELADEIVAKVCLHYPQLAETYQPEPPSKPAHHLEEVLSALAL